MDKDKHGNETTSEPTESPAEIAYIRAKLIEAEKRGFTKLGRDEILAKFKDEMRRNGEL
ncbi:MAG: hypothetical protein L3J04_06240 [Robiginitomaculum sp.]|nr:hypothetical protein [Robiginitomaculum sp.]